MKTKILYLNETPFENGKKSGEYFRKIIQNQLQKIDSLLSNEKFLSQSKVLSMKLKEKYPTYYDEIYGKAKGANVDFDKYFLFLCPELYEKQDHCTTIICKNLNNNFILSHNEDDEYTEDNFCLSKIKIKNGWFATNDIYHMPFGNGFSWNSFGIVKTINYCHEEYPNWENFSRYISQRHISEANSIEDLIKRCNEIKPASGFHVNALDINKNIAVTIEVYTDKIDVKYIDDFYIHSNHFLRGNQKNLIDEGSNSIFRQDKATDLFIKLKNHDLKSIKNILNYRSEDDTFEHSIFQTKKDPYITGMNFSYDIDTKNKVLLDVYVNDETLELDYDL